MFGGTRKTTRRLAPDEARLRAVLHHQHDVDLLARHLGELEGLGARQPFDHPVRLAVGRQAADEDVVHAVVEAPEIRDRGLRPRVEDIILGAVGDQRDVGEAEGAAIALERVREALDGTERPRRVRGLLLHAVDEVVDLLDAVAGDGDEFELELFDIFFHAPDSSLGPGSSLGAGAERLLKAKPLNLPQVLLRKG